MSKSSTKKGLLKNTLLLAKSGQVSRKARFLYFILIVIAGLIIVDLAKVDVDNESGNKSASLKEVFEGLITPSSEEKSLFFSQNESLRPESPELSLVGENSLISVSAPEVFSPRVLGAMVGKEYSEAPQKVREYIVEEGDSLWVIAEKFNISIDTIKWANDISGSTITPGQKLVILPIDGVLHLVESGDTLSEIAETYKYKGDLSELIAFNNLSKEEEIYIGDVLIVPGGKMPSTPPVIRQVPLASSYFIFPTEGKVSQGAHWPPRYTAVDVANVCGTPIRAAASGKVYQTGYNWPGGRFVKILHPNGVVTYYGHLSRILVSEGEDVYQGKKIGTMGYTGLTIPRGPAGCHLHFDVFGAKNPLLKYPVGSIINYK